MSDPAAETDPHDIQELLAAAVEGPNEVPQGVIEVSRREERLAGIGPDVEPEDQELLERLAATAAPAITGIFYHHSFSRRSYLTAGRRLADFPGALDALLQHPQIRLFECPLATDEQILRVHDPALIPVVESDPL